MFEALNRKGTVMDGVKLDEMEFAPLKSFAGEELAVEGFFFTEGQYGRQVVVVANGTKINFPARAVDEFQKIADNDAMLDAVLTGHLAINDIHMIKTKNGSTVAYKFADR